MSVQRAGLASSLALSALFIGSCEREREAVPVQAEALPGPASPSSATRPEDLSEEITRLGKLKAARFEELKKQALATDGHRMLALYKIADLGTPEAVAFLGEARARHERREQLRITDMLCRIGRPECIPLLQKSLESRDSFQRWHAAEALAAIQGRQSVPLLRDLFENDPDEHVRYVVHEELAKLGDRTAIASILADLGKTDRVTVDSALYAAHVAHVTEAAGAALQIFRETDEKMDLDLKMRAGVTALALGEKAAFPLLVELMDRTSAEEQTRPWGEGIHEDLKMLTRKDFGRSAEKWLQWWNATKGGRPIYTWHASGADRTAITRAAIAWGKSAESGPFIKEDVVYLRQDVVYLSQDVVYLRREGQDEALRDGKLRPYTGVELELLGMRWSSYAVRDVDVAGNHAVATLHGFETPEGTDHYRLELLKKNGVWTVVNASREDPY